MRYIVPQDRYQIESNFGCLDDMIEPNNIVRVIDYFVDGLDLKALDFTKAIPEAKGRKPYNPKQFVEIVYLWLFESYSIQSSFGKGDQAQYRAEMAFRKSFTRL